MTVTSSVAVGDLPAATVRPPGRDQGPHVARHVLRSANTRLKIADGRSTTARFGFVSFDDQIYVVDYPHVRSGVTSDGLLWAFGPASGEGTCWHPPTWASLLLNCSLFGVDPGAHHVVAVAIHAANAALLLVLNAATGSRWRSLAVAALFAVHPINVETVAWIAEARFTAAAAAAPYNDQIQANLARCRALLAKGSR